VKLRAYLFEWPSRHSLHLALSLMIGVSLVLHVLGMVVFQISYPRAKMHSIRSAEVFYIQPGTQEAQDIAPLLAAADPALFSPGQVFGKDAWKSPETLYTPSFDTDKPSLVPLPAASPALVMPLMASSDPISITPYRPRQAATPAPGLPTVVKLGGGLKGRVLESPKGIRFSAHASKGLLPSEFLLSVSPEGRVLYVFALPQESYGNEVLDRTAMQYLLKAKFSPIEDSKPRWGTATFLWGTDVDRDRDKAP